MNSPLISVIVPVYKVENFLVQCIDSILSQSYTNFELILINDGSPDNCGLMCDEYAAKDKRITVIHKTNEGLMTAWIDGLTISKGVYISFVDSDDWLAQDALLEMLDMALTNEADMVCCGFYTNFEHEQKEITHLFKSGLYDVRDFKTKLYPELISNGGFLSRGVHITRWAKLIKKQYILENLIYCNKEISIGEDFNIIFPVLLSCKRIYINNEIFVYHYRQEDNSMMRAYDEKLFMKVKLLYGTLLDISKKKEVYDFTEQINTDFLHMVIYCVIKELEHFNRGTYERIRNIADNPQVRGAFENSISNNLNKYYKLIWFVLKSRSTLLLQVLRGTTVVIKLLKG